MNIAVRRGGTVLIGPISVAGQRLTSNPYSAGILTVHTILSHSGIDVRQLEIDINLQHMREEQVIKATAGEILEQKPDIVGFSTTCGLYGITLLIAKALKETVDSVRIVLGGPQASSVWRETLSECPWIDMILVGEAEQVLLPIWHALLNGTELREQPGLALRIDGKPCLYAPAPRLDNLDDLEGIDWALLPESTSNRIMRLEIEAGRGCPYSCVFCSTSSFWGRRFRIKSPSRLVSEMKDAMKATGISRISLVHDLLTISRDWVTEFCRELADQQVSFQWTCSARLDTLDPELMRLMAGVGCIGIFIGLESGSERIREFIGKTWEPEKAVQTVRAAAEIGMNLNLSFIMGFPGETAEDMLDTVRLALECRRRGTHTVELIFHSLSPFLDSPLYEQMGDLVEYDQYGSFTMDYFAFDTPTLKEFALEHPKLCSIAYHYRNNCVQREHTISVIILMIFLSRCGATLKALDLLFEEDLAEILFYNADEVRPDVMGNIQALSLISLEMERFLERIIGEKADRVPWLMDLFRFESSRVCVMVLPESEARAGIFYDMDHDVQRISAILLDEGILPPKDGFEGEYCSWCYGRPGSFRRALLPRSLGNRLKPPES